MYWLQWLLVAWQVAKASWRVPAYIAAVLVVIGSAHMSAFYVFLHAPLLIPLLIVAGALYFGWKAFVALSKE